MVTCPKCGQTAEETSDEFPEKFYAQRWSGYLTCRNCTRRFSTKSNVVCS